MDEAMAVLDKAGELLFADDLWMQLSRLARGEPISPRGCHDELRALQVCMPVFVIPARSPNKSLHVVASRRGP